MPIPTNEARTRSRASADHLRSLGNSDYVGPANDALHGETHHAAHEIRHSDPRGVGRNALQREFGCEMVRDLEGTNWGMCRVARGNSLQRQQRRESRYCGSVATPMIVNRSSSEPALSMSRVSSTTDSLPVFSMTR